MPSIAFFKSLLSTALSLYFVSNIPFKCSVGFNFLFMICIFSYKVVKPCKLNISAFIGAIALVLDTKAFKVSIPKVGGVSIII